MDLLDTSGLPGRKRVTPRAYGSRRRAIHPLHRAPTDRHCCPTRAGPVPFLKIAPQASAWQRLARAEVVPPSAGEAREARAASAVAPVPFLNRILCRNRQFCNLFRIFTH